MRVEGTGSRGNGGEAQGSGACHVCINMSHKPEPKPSQPPAAEVVLPPQAVRGYGGPGLANVRVEVARMQADAAPQPPSLASSATSAEVSSPSSPESPETVRREGRRAAGRQRGEGAAAGTGEGGDKGGQAEASGGRTEGLVAETEGKGEGQRQQAVERWGADPFNISYMMEGVDAGRGESIVDDILVVSEDEGEGARRMAVEGGRGQPTTPNVPAAAMKSILPEVRRQEEGKGGRGQQAASAAGSGDSSVRTGGRGRTGTGGKGQAGTSGARHAKGRQEGKGGKGVRKGRQCPQPQHLFKQPPPGSPRQVSAAVRAEKEREVRSQQAPRYEALAHVERQRRRHQPPEPGPDTTYRLEMESGRTRSGRQGGLERSGGEHSGQPSGGVRREGGQAEQSSAAAEGRRGQREGVQGSGNQRSGHTGSAVQGRGGGQVEGGKGEHSGQGTQRKGAGQAGLQGKGHGQAGLHGPGSKGHGAAGRKRERARGGGWLWVHGLTGDPGEGMGMVGRCSPASHPNSHPTVPTATLPGDGDDVPAPAGVPGHAGTGTRAAVPAGQWDNVGGTGREGRRAQEGMGEDRGGREEPEGERGQGHGWGGQVGGGEDGGDRQAAGRGGAGSGGAAVGVGRPSEKAGEVGEGRTGRRTT